MKQAELALQDAASRLRTDGGAFARYNEATAIVRALGVLLSQRGSEQVKEIGIAARAAVRPFEFFGPTTLATTDRFGVMGRMSKRSVEEFETELPGLPLFNLDVGLTTPKRSEYVKRLRGFIEECITHNESPKFIALILLGSLLDSPLTEDILTYGPWKRRADLPVTEAFGRLEAKLTTAFASRKQPDAEAILKLAARALGYPPAKVKRLFGAEDTKNRRARRKPSSSLH